jgi:hypothetical protein
MPLRSPVAALVALVALAAIGAAPDNAAGAEAGVQREAAALDAPVVVPLSRDGPKIDGHVDAAEWRSAAVFDGFGRDGRLTRRRATGYVAATADTLYVAVVSELPAEGSLAATVMRDTAKVVFDDAVEVLINPTPDRPAQACYQFLANSIGKCAYVVHTRGGAAADPAWTGGWRHASGSHDGAWHFECAVPIASLPAAGAGRAAGQGLWKLNLTRDWKAPWEWSSLSAEGGAFAFSGRVFRFADAAPAVAQRFTSDPAVAPFEALLEVANPTAAALEVAASLALERNNMPALKAAETLSLAPGAARTLRLAVPRDDPTRHYTLTARVTGAAGVAPGAAGPVLFERTAAWQRGEPWRWAARAEAAAGRPIDFNFAYYPSANRLRVVADVSGLAKEARLTALAATVREAKSKKAVASVAFDTAGFTDGRQERAADLPPLEGEYEIVLAAQGDGVPREPVVRTFERTRYEWEGEKLGTSARVYPPFTPIEADPAARTVKTVLRKHTLTDIGLVAQVEATSAQTGVTRPLLAAPMRLVAKVGGQAHVAAARPDADGSLFRGDAATPDAVETRGYYVAGPLRGQVRGRWEYDGCLRVDLWMCGTEGGAAIEELTLEIPLRADAATMIHANADRIRAPVAQRLPAGDGIVWDASKVACDDYLKNFCPYIYLGDAVRGLCWFAENDGGWSWDRATPNLTVVRQGGEVVLRVHLVNKPIVTGARKITFGLMAAPVKPRYVEAGQPPGWWRYRYLRDGYTLLGTDINWFGIGCGSVYPVGGDLGLWEVLKRGNAEKLGQAEVDATIARGMPFFEKRGADAVRSWRAHVAHNLRSRFGKRMVFYYNRAAIQCLPEYETFKDEWNLTDLRSVGKGDGADEIKIVPSASYNNFALHWYAKSFELGGNQGVYWDNWFIAPSFNTAMTDAYADADGTVVPAAGIWAMRELAKRTFVMMNERGMRPITFPHMTSFNPLPMMSFATVQYDWEWKYSEGDVQDRFTRDLILLMTTGDLAGVWPVLLPDHGPQTEDAWTQRTFAAVRLVHELDGSGGFGGHTKISKDLDRLAAPVLEILDEPGLAVWRWWDDRPQPVAADSPDVPTIVYAVPGRRAVVVAASYAAADRNVTLTVDAAAMGLAGPLRVTNAETGEALPVAGGKVRFALKKHDVRVLRIEAGGSP